MNNTIDSALSDDALARITKVCELEWSEGISCADKMLLVNEIERLRKELIEMDDANDFLRQEGGRLIEALKIAHGGLRRALDYRAATPEGLAIKADIRETLIKSGDHGPWGVVGSG